MAMDEIIKAKLAVLRPERLDIINDSARHHGHAGDNGTGESHFKLTIVSQEFEGLSRVDRQKLIYNLLKDEMVNAIHALSVKAQTPQEYFKN